MKHIIKNDIKYIGWIDFGCVRDLNLLTANREFDYKAFIKEGFYTIRVGDHLKVFGKEDCFFMRNLFFWYARSNAAVWIGDIKAFLRYRDLFHDTVTDLLYNNCYVESEESINEILYMR